MNSLNHYQGEMQEIARSASKQKGGGGLVA